MTQEKTTTRKKLKGAVVSDRMEGSAVVLVDRYVKHPKYKKHVKHQKRYIVDTGGKEYAIGDRVIIEESKPISKKKRFRIIEKI